MDKVDIENLKSLMKKLSWKEYYEVFSDTIPDLKERYKSEAYATKPDNYNKMNELYKSLKLMTDFLELLGYAESD